MDSDPGLDSHLDTDFVRSQFPAFAEPSLAGWAFFENAGGSYPCIQTVEALDRYYRRTKVQPYGPYPAAEEAGRAMDRSRRRWAAALGVAVDDVHFGPSTSMNTYVLAQAIGRALEPGAEIIVTNQDHEANTGAFRRVLAEYGATVVEWRTDPVTGLLDLERLADLLTERTAYVTMPHCSNIVGQENDVAAATALAHQAGARIVVDGVSFAPHTFPDLGAIGADVYLFSLYKTYSVHQGLLVTGNGMLDAVTNQGHFFNEGQPTKRLTPAGPDHAQEAAAGAVLDYVEAVHRHHGGHPEDDLRVATAAVSELWRDHERALLPELVELLAGSDRARLLGPVPSSEPGLHRCPTVAFVPLEREPDEVAASLAEAGIMCGSGHFYAYRVLDGMDVDPERGVVRLSFVHYTDRADVDRLLDALPAVLSRTGR